MQFKWVSEGKQQFVHSFDELKKLIDNKYADNKEKKLALLINLSQRGASYAVIWPNIKGLKVRKVQKEPIYATIDHAKNQVILDFAIEESQPEKASSWSYKTHVVVDLAKPTEAKVTYSRG